MPPVYMYIARPHTLTLTLALSRDRPALASPPRAGTYDASSLSSSTFHIWRAWEANPEVQIDFVSMRIESGSNVGVLARVMNARTGAAAAA